MQQVVELVADRGQLPVDVPDGLDDRLAPQRVIMGRTMRGARAGELKIGLPQRQTQAVPQRTDQQRKLFGRIRLAIHRRHGESDERAIQFAGLVGGKQGRHLRRMPNLVANHVDFDTVLENLDSLEPLLQRFDRPGHLTGLERGSLKVGSTVWHRRIVRLAAVGRGPDLDDQECTEFARQRLRDAGAPICDTLGWNSGAPGAIR